MDYLLNPTPGILTLAAADWVTGLLIVGFLVCSVLLILTVLIQRPQGGGLSGAFGGGGSAGGETAFGARTGDALTMATISFFVLWLAVAVGLVLVMTPSTAPPPDARAVSNEGPETPEGAEGGGATEGADEETPAGGGDTAPTGDTPPDDTTDNSTEDTTELPAGDTGDSADGE